MLVNPNPPPACSARFGWAFASAAIALSGSLLLLRDFGTALPYQDQWKCTGVEILAPWSAGHLTLSHFFTFHNDHSNAVSRLTSFGLLRINGQWNNLVEACLSACVLAAAVFAFVRIATARLEPLAVALLALGTGFTFALPYSWENTLFGIQINVTVELLLALLYFRAVASERTFTPAWWVGHACAGLALLTQRSGMMAAASALPYLLWRAWCENGTARRASFTGILIAGGWLLLFLLTAPAISVTAGMKSESWRLVLDTLLRQLGWPLPHPGWALLVYAPAGWLTLDLLRRRRPDATGGFLLLVVLWVAIHALAIGYARGGVTTGFVSRYTTYLAAGLVANGAALGLLRNRIRRQILRRTLLALTLVWSGTILWGLWRESTTAHAAYNLERRLEFNRANLAAVQAFVTTGDSTGLNSEVISQTLYPHAPTLTALLSDPHLRALLPPETGAREARRDYGRLGELLGFALHSGPPLLLLLAGLAVLLSLRREISPRPDTAAPATRWRSPHTAALSTLVALASWAALLAWEQPWTFDPLHRFNALACSAGKSHPVGPLSFSAEIGRAIAQHELVGAVPTDPSSRRPAFFGTWLGGNSYTGIVHSGEFTITDSHLALLLTGWPNSPGNAVRWQVENPATGEKHWLPALGPPDGPGPRLRAWSVDVSAYRGWQAKLYLFDGTTDERGWVGVTTPVTCSDPNLATRWLVLVDSERSESSHAVLLAVAIVAALLAIFSGVRALTQPKAP